MKRWSTYSFLYHTITKPSNAPVSKDPPSNLRVSHDRSGGVGFGTSPPTNALMVFGIHFSSCIMWRNRSSRSLSTDVMFLLNYIQDKINTRQNTPPDRDPSDVDRAVELQEAKTLFPRCRQRPAHVGAPRTQRRGELRRGSRGSRGTGGRCETSSLTRSAVLSQSGQRVCASHRDGGAPTASRVGCLLWERRGSA